MNKVNKVVTSLAVLASCITLASCGPTEPTDPTTAPSVEPSVEPSIEPEYTDNYYNNVIIPFNNGTKDWSEVADPSIVKGDDGYWYIFVTGGQGGGKSYRSRDCVTWTLHSPNVIPRPTWGDYRGGDTPIVWAPDVVKIKDKWIYYYSLSGLGNCHGIGYAVADEIAGPYEDKGKLVSVEELNLQNCIDPAIVRDGDRIFMAVGSFQGVDMVELNEDGMSLKGDSPEEWRENKTLIAGIYGPWDGAQTEGHYFIQKDGYYYYFGSEGTCCVGVESTYQVVVARSKAVTGPYVDDKGNVMANNRAVGKVVLFASKSERPDVVGPGHCSIFQDDAGDYWMIYHAYVRDDVFHTRHLMMDKILWDEKGWPYIHGNKKFQASYQEELPAPRFIEE